MLFLCPLKFNLLVFPTTTRNSSFQPLPAASHSYTQVKGENDKINVKRLPKKPAPPRFGRKLTARQMELASHICVGACVPDVPDAAASLPCWLVCCTA
jgi:hypothetical protein